MKDKIYVDKFGQSIEGHIPEGSDLVTEYIRKDALLEWIEETRAVPHENAITRDLAFQEVVNKLNEM